MAAHPRLVRGLLFAVATAVATPLALLSSAAQAGTGLVTPTYLRTLGGPGHAAVYPSGMEIAPNGNVVLADTGNDQVAEYTASGTLLWRVGSEGNAAPCGVNGGVPQFEQPRDVGVDSAGNVYVADNGNGRVLKLSGTTGKCIAKPFKLPGGGAPIGITVSATPAGQLVYVSNGTRSAVVVFTTSGAVSSTIVSQGTCRLNRMRDAAADAAGNVYVANYESNNILEFTATGTCIRTWGTKGAGNGQFMNPYGVAIGTDPYINNGSPGEAIYVADSNNDRIEEFTPTGVYVAQMGSMGDDTQPGTFTQLRRVAVDASGNVWGADLWGYRAELFLRGPAGYTYSATIPTPVVQPGSTDTSVYNQVRGIGFDAAGDVLTMDSVNQRVVVMDPTGHIISMCGQRGFTSVGDFNWPRGVAVDPVANQIWVADTKQSDLQIVKNDPGCEGVAQLGGTVGTAVGQLDYPYSIAIGGGYAWVADTKNNRIESWNVATRTAVSVYGTKGSGAGQFNNPAGIAVDGTTGNVYVADSGNHRVVELNVRSGAVTSAAKVIAVPGNLGASSPYGVASDGAGHIAVADRVGNDVVVLNEADGTVAATITASDVTGGGPTSLQNPENVAFGPANGHLYIADTYNDRVLEYALS